MLRSLSYLTWLHKVAGNANVDEPPPVLTLVTTKAHEIFLDWASLLSVGSLNTIRLRSLRELLDELESEEEVEYWMANAVLHFAEIMTDYYNRFMMLCRDFPLLLMWLIASPHDVEDDNRKLVCKDLIRTSDEDIGDETTIKIRTLFREVFLNGAESGKIPYQLWQTLMIKIKNNKQAIMTYTCVYIYIYIYKYIQRYM